jgi:serine/threonine protein kinase
MYGCTEVALKTAIHVDQDNQQGVTALANEVRLLRRIRHSNIVMFHGVMLEGNLRGIAMVLEWVEGDNLDRYMRPRRLVVQEGVEKHTHAVPPGTPAVQSSCKLLEDVSRGVQYLHAQNPVILHRDLKPANILVETIAQPPRAKIADFGLSVLLKGAGQTGRAGTTGYMAPEVKRGELYSRGADAYSFGGVALFVLTGRHPDSSLVELALNEDATSVGVFDWSQQRNAKAAVSQVSQLCLRERPEERPNFCNTFGILASASDGS